MWNLSQSRSLYAATTRRTRRRRTSGVVLAVVAIAGLMLASTASVSAQERYDWYEWSDNWESSRDPGGWDAIVMMGYERGADDYWISAEFSAYGEHLWVENKTEDVATVTLSVQEFAEYEDWIYLDVAPGECITWGWEHPPKSFPDCFYLGDGNMPEDKSVILNICGQDPFGANCRGEEAES